VPDRCRALSIIDLDKNRIASVVVTGLFGILPKRDHLHHRGTAAAGR
jgi:hypothetical protein